MATDHSRVSLFKTKVDRFLCDWKAISYTCLFNTDNFIVYTLSWDLFTSELETESTLQIAAKNNTENRKLGKNIENKLKQAKDEWVNEKFNNNNNINNVMTGCTFIYISYCAESMDTMLQKIGSKLCLARQLEKDKYFQTDRVIHNRWPDIIVVDKGTKKCHYWYLPYQMIQIL